MGDSMGPPTPNKKTHQTTAPAAESGASNNGCCITAEEFMEQMQAESGDQTTMKWIEETLMDEYERVWEQPPKEAGPGEKQNIPAKAGDLQAKAA